ncbi:MAG: leucine-rich repeat protein [Ruminococcus sp.]
MKRSIFSRTLSCFSSVVIFAASAAFTASAENTASTPEDEEVTSFSDGLLTYNVIDDSRFVEITSCVSTATNVNILPKIDGYTVTAIGEGAFAGCEQLQSVTFPKNAELTSIGSYAFAECSSLETVTLPNSVTEIPVGMFAYCTSLESVTFGDKTEYISDEAFRECTSLTDIELPETLTGMGNFVFYMCTSLETIEFPEKLSEIGGYNFSGCVNIKSINIPASLLDLGDAPFLGCMGLTDITAEEDNPNYTVEDGVLYSKDKTVLYFYPPAREDKSFTVPEGVTDIYDGAFFQCTNLQEVIFPEGLETIGAGAFDFCTSLAYARIPESVTNIMSTAFSDCDALESVTFVGADNETDGTGSPLTIGDHAFYACEMLKEVVLPKRTASIGDYAFGVTEITDESGNAIPTAVGDFMLRGFDSAESYIKDCDVSVGFSPRSFPWKKVVFWVCAAAVLIVIVFFSVMIVKKNMMTPEEKAALKKAKEERLKKSVDSDNENEPETEKYESILGDDDETENTEDAKDSGNEEVTRFKGAATSRLHHIGHGEE